MMLNGFQMEQIKHQSLGETRNIKKEHLAIQVRLHVPKARKIKDDGASQSARRSCWQLQQKREHRRCWDETTQQASSTHCTSVLFTHGPRMSHELQSLTTSHNSKPCWVSTSSSILWSSGGPTGKWNCNGWPTSCCFFFFCGRVQSRFWSRQISAKRNYRTSHGLYNGSDAAG